MPEPGPFGETFFDASERAMTLALLVKRSLGGWVESVVTVFTQRRLAEDFAFVESFFDVEWAGMREKGIGHRV
jgi:hypothetical protein